MKPIVFIASVLCLLLGLFYELASSPDYRRILLYAVGLEIAAGASFVYLLRAGSRRWRVALLLALAAAAYTLGEAAVRLNHFLWK